MGIYYLTIEQPKKIKRWTFVSVVFFCLFKNIIFADENGKETSSYLLTSEHIKSVFNANNKRKSFNCLVNIISSKILK